MRTLILLIALALAPALASAARICVWNYDSLDRFFDPVRAESVDCAVNVAAGLAALGHTVEVHASLPGNLAGYDAVFCLMGWYRC